LIAYGELDLAKDDELVQEMLDAATGAAFNKESNNEDVRTPFPKEYASWKSDKEDIDNQTESAGETSTAFAKTHPVLLNVKTFAQALTYDTRLYDIRNEVRVATNIDDVYVSPEMVAMEKEGNDENNFSKENSKELQVDDAFPDMDREGLAVGKSLTRKGTLPAIDITAGTYKSKGLIIMLWATILVTYFG
jgi:hypothetical protein